MPVLNNLNRLSQTPLSSPQSRIENSPRNSFDNEISRAGSPSQPSKAQAADAAQSAKRIDGPSEVKSEGSTESRAVKPQSSGKGRILDIRV